MKLYQYQCQKCYHSFKRIFLILQDAPFACPKCGDINAKKALNYTTLSPENGIGRADNRSEWVPWTELTLTGSVGDENAL